MRTSLLGIVTFALLSTGCKKSADKDGVTINSKPVANAGSDIRQTADSPVTLDGGGSYDPDGDPISFNWTFDSVPSGSALGGDDNPFPGNHSTAATTEFHADTAGTYIVRLVVDDNKGDSSDADFVVVTVEGGEIPVADAGSDTSGTEGDTFTLDGSHSYDPLGRNLTYAWSFTSVPSSSVLTALTGPTSAQASFMADVGGVYIAALVVDNGISSSNPDTVIVKVASASELPPVALAGTDVEASDCTEVSLSARDSYDPNGDDLDFLWSLQSKPSDSSATNDSFADRAGESTTFYPDVAGDYLLTLAVSDGQAWSSPDLLTITASERTYNSAPVVDAGSRKSSDAGEADCTLNGYTYDCDDCATVTFDLGDDATVTDADGDPLVLKWAILSGDGATIADENTLATTVTIKDLAPEEEGTVYTADYEFQLTATDCTAETMSDTVIFSVSCTGT